MKIVLKCLFLVFLLAGLSGCREGAVDKEISIISLNPDAAKSFVASDFFDDYRILTFKDIICTKIGDFVEINDKIIASSIIIQGFSDSITICVFDTTGHYLYPLGAVGCGPGEYQYISRHIELTEDTTIFIKSSLGWVEYALDGQLLGERRMTQAFRGILGAMQWKISDNTLLFLTSTDLRENRENAPLIQLTSSDDFCVKRSYLPLELTKEYITENSFYAFKDTACVFVDAANCVYMILEDTIIPRYKVDKGKYGALTPFDMVKENITILPNSIRVKRLSENRHYLIGKYLFNQKYYFFIYDKFLNKTYNLKSQLEDDILFGKISGLFYCWEPGVQISDEYMYFYFTPMKFSNLVESVRKNLSETDWKAYQQSHPDIMEIFHGLNENSNTVVVGYKFR